MNIIRYNSFRWVNLFSRNSFFYKYDECLESDNGLCAYLNDKRLMVSKYNIIKHYDDNQTVIYNTLYDSIVILENKENDQFNQYNMFKGKSGVIRSLYRLGILVLDSEDETALMNLQNEELVYNRKGIPSVTILPTQACNARCQYCFAEHNTKYTMTQDTIFRLVEFMKANFCEGDRVLLRWFGGEPLLASDIINEIVDKINITFHGNLRYSSLMFTNGSLLDDKLIECAKNKWHMEKIQLTLDGYAKEHNKRKSYLNEGVDYYNKTIIDIGKLLDAGIKVDCRVNLDKDNIKQIDDICRDLKQYKSNALFRPRFTILRPSDCGFNRFNYITTNDLEWAYSIIYNKLIEYGFLKHIQDLIPCRQKESCIRKSINKVIIGSDGKLYKCLQQVFDDDSAVGDLKNGIDYEKHMSCCRTPLREQCKNCVYLPICSGGCEAYWKLSQTENVLPCIREKYFINMLLDMIHEWEIMKNVY